MQCFYLNSSGAAGQLMQTVWEFGFFRLDKRVIECSGVELFEAMNCVFEVCYNLEHVTTTTTISWNTSQPEQLSHLLINLKSNVIGQSTGHLLFKNVLDAFHSSIDLHVE